MGHSHGRRWTDEDVKREILAVADDGAMPTNAQLVSLGRGDLGNQIARRGGFRKWAADLGLSTRDSCTARGRKWEDTIASELSVLGYIAEQQSTLAPFDILVNDRVRINVKSAKYSAYGACRGHFFGIGRTWGACDMFALVKVLDPMPHQVLWVPWRLCRQQTVTLTPGHHLNSFTDPSIIGDLLAKAA